MSALLTAGPVPAKARLTVILVHGRGADAADILTIADELRLDDVAYVAPQGGGRSWYPYSFLSPISDNEPALSSALRVLSRLIEGLQRDGVDTERIALLGFSQGACLSLEYAARYARRYAGVVGLSGGLIGPPGMARNDAGSLDGTPVFLGCSDVDPHIPLSRVEETAAVLQSLGGTVDERIYPGMGHTISADELFAVRRLFEGPRR